MAYRGARGKWGTCPEVSGHSTGVLRTTQKAERGWTPWTTHALCRERGPWGTVARTQVHSAVILTSLRESQAQEDQNRGLWTT